MAGLASPLGAVLPFDESVADYDNKMTRLVSALLSKLDERLHAEVEDDDDYVDGAGGARLRGLSRGGNDPPARQRTTCPDL